LVRERNQKNNGRDKCYSMTEHPRRCKTCMREKCRYKKFVDPNDEGIKYEYVHYPDSNIFYFVKSYGCGSHMDERDL
jgi:hypothetical protein